MSNYFARFPVVKGYQIIGRTLDMMDITKRTGFVQGIKQNETTYIDYTVEDGETPIVLADRIYDDAELYWVIMMFNDMYDINADWPLDAVSLNRYIKRIYVDPNGIHHYESIATGAFVLNGTHPDYDTLPVTNWEHEMKVNDAKRKIKVPIPEAVEQLVAEHNRLIQQ